MNTNVKAGISVYHASATKYIIATICIVVLIRVLHNTVISLSGCSNIKENASQAVELGGKAYNAYQDFQQPQRIVRK